MQRLIQFLCKLTFIKPDTDNEVLQKARFRHAVNHVTKQLHETKENINETTKHNIREKVKQKMYPNAKFDPHSTMQLTHDKIRKHTDNVLSKPYDPNSKSVQDYKSKSPKNLVTHDPETLKRRYLINQVNKKIKKHGYTISPVDKSSITVHVTKRLNNKVYTGLSGKPTNTLKRVITPDSKKKRLETIDKNKIEPKYAKERY